jgi:hypothetical protein
MTFEVHSNTARKTLGSTWVGATPVLRTYRVGFAALVAPTHVLPETKTSTVPVLTEYQTGPQEWPQGEQS